MQKLITIFLFLVVMINLNAQRDYQVSQFMYNQTAINPGAAGNLDMACVSGFLRRQWTGMEGTPQNIIINANTPFRLLKKDHGLGLTFFKENIGFNEDIDLKVCYAYRANVGDGKLGIGAGLNITNRGYKAQWSAFDLVQSSYNNGNDDNSIPKGEEKVFAIDFSFGIFYKTEDLYFGISSTHINENNYKFYYEQANTDIPDIISRHYYITSGYRLQLANPSFELTPSVLIQSDGKIHKFDLNTILTYNKKFWCGVSVRPGSDVIGMLGFEILNGAKIGFAYDFPTSAITNYYNTSYEILINYCFKIGVDKTPQKYKSIRFL